MDLSLNVENVPVSAVAQLARRAKKNLPVDLVSTGSVQGSFTVKEEGASARGPEFQGRGEITDLRLQSASARVEFAPGSVPFVLSSRRAGARASSQRAIGAYRTRCEVLPAPDELHVEYGPFPVALGRPVAGAGPRLGGAVGLWNGRARRWGSRRTRCDWPACLACRQ